jgi:hypothetical protein
MKAIYARIYSVLEKKVCLHLYEPSVPRRFSWGALFTEISKGGVPVSVEIAGTSNRNGEDKKSCAMAKSTSSLRVHTAPPTILIKIEWTWSDEGVNKRAHATNRYF